MATTVRSNEKVSVFGYNLTNTEPLNKFMDAFNDSYNHLYITSNWQDLKNFIRDSLTSFETITFSQLSTKAENFLINNFHSLSKIDSSINLGYFSNLSKTEKNLLYPNIILNFILTSNVKIHNHEYDFNLPTLDILVFKYRIYTTLYLSLVDICVKLYEFDSAVETLIQLGIVQYYLRVQISNLLFGCDEYFFEGLSIDYTEIVRELDRKGIYLSVFEEFDTDYSIIKHVITYFNRQTDLEIWSRIVKIFLNIDSIYNALNKIEDLPFFVRQKIFFNVKFFLSDLPIRNVSVSMSENLIISSLSFFEQEYEEFKSYHYSLSNIDYLSKIDDRQSMTEMAERISRTDIISHVFASNFSFQCFFTEGILMFAHLCKDFYHDLFSFVYSILFDVLMIFVSINLYYRKYKRKKLTSKFLSGILGYFKLRFKHYNFIPPIFQLVYNQYIFDNKLNAVSPEIISPKFMLKSKILKKFKNPILGFHEISSLLKSDIEYNFLFHSSNFFDSTPVLYEEFKILPHSPTNSSSKTVEFNLNFKQLDISTLSSETFCKRRCMESLLINGIEISKFNKLNDKYNYIHFLRSIYYIKNKVRIKNVVPTEFSNNYYYLSFRCSNEGNWMIPGYPDNILSVIISICFLIDDIYMSIHYSQSLEYLQYTDTLKTKNRAIVQTLLPFLPKRSSKDAKKIILFQKHIKKRFKTALMYSRNFIPFIPNLKKTYSSVVKYLFRSEHKPSCEVYLKNKRGFESKISFKITSVKRNDHPSLSKFKNKLINPLLSSSKALYGRSYTNRDFKNNRTNRKSISKYNSGLSSFLNSYTTGENVNTNRLFSSNSKCIHFSLGSSFKECDFCQKLNSFKHLSHLMYLIDLLSYHLFTLNVTFEPYNYVHLPNQINTNSKDSTKAFYHNSMMVVDQPDINSSFSDIMSKIEKSFYYKSCTYYNKNDYPFKILKECIENAILLSFSTVFHESYHNHLLSRLAIYHLIKGRFNIALHLLLQTLSETNTYKVDYGSNDMHIKENYLCDFDKSFKVQLVSKIYLELLEDVYSFRRLNNITAETKFDVTDEQFFGYTYRLCLMTGFSYLKEAPSKFMNSYSILDYNFLKFNWNIDSNTSQFLFLSKFQNPEKNEFVENDSYRSMMKLATETFLKAVTINPSDYKSWYHLARVSLYSNDLHFAYKCCQRSIECFDSFIASWLTLVLCNSTRIRTCSPFITDEDTLDRYFNIKTFENSVSFKSLPSPLEPLSNPPVTTLDELETHLENFVGDDLENCIIILDSLQNFKNIYVSTSILQLIARLHNNYNSFFPWELRYLSDQTKSRVSGSKSSRNGSSPRNKDTSSEFYNHVKKMVTTSAESNYLLCVVPFMSLVLQTFFKKKFNIKCRHHSCDQYGYNSSGLSLNFMEAELYGWISCIEVLSQIGQHHISQLLLPILDLYMEYYSIDKYFKRKNEKNVCKMSYANRNERKRVRRYFHKEPMISLDLVLEIKYIKFYTKCYNTYGGSDSLKDLLEELDGLNVRANYRKFSMLQNRIYVGLKEYNNSIQISNQIHRSSLKIMKYTDFDLEYKSLQAFAHSLKMVNESEESEKVITFAKQLYLTTPILKLDLCLNVPL